MLDYLRI